MRNCRNHNWNFFFFFFAWDLYSLFFTQGVQFDLSPSYLNVLKNGSAPLPSPRGWVSGGCKLCYLTITINFSKWIYILFLWWFQQKEVQYNKCNLNTLRKNSVFFNLASSSATLSVESFSKSSTVWIKISFCSLSSSM